MSKIKTAFSACALACCLAAGTAQAQTSASDSVYQHAKGNRLSIGGYGEVALTRNFYSDNVYRYRNPGSYANDPGHGRFDVPHAVIYLSYDFGKGWTMSSEIEFEHGGSGGAVEKEWEEGGEWEQETEKGGEVELEQFWIQKSFAPWANIRIGHMVVPVGLTNAHHEPLNYFTVYRPEGEGTILPSTWHDTGIGFWGRLGDFRYELQVLAGLDAMLFNRDNWIQSGAGTPFEFKVANKYFTDEEINRLSVVAPNIGLSIIKDYEIVEKKTVKTPDTLKGIVKCNNPKCITNNEPMQTLFHTVDKVLGIVRCHYCDKEQQLDKVELCK